MPYMKNNTTANRLKEALSLRNMKSSELSIQTGIGKSSISQYISGFVVPKQDRIYAMAKVLQVNESWLMGYDVDRERTTTTPSTSSVPNLVEIICNDSYTLAGRPPTPADRTYLSNMVDTYIDESSDQTIAAHRTDSPSADLPEEALQSIEEFKNFVRAKYKKD
jgi:transcriptional regulator with XRE-family HTH domain